MILKEIAHEYSLEELILKTGCEFAIPENVGAF